MFEYVGGILSLWVLFNCKYRSRHPRERCTRDLDGDLLSWQKLNQREELLQDEGAGKQDFLKIKNKIKGNGNGKREKRIKRNTNNTRKKHKKGKTA